MNLLSCCLQIGYFDKKKLKYAFYLSYNAKGMQSEAQYLLRSQNSVAVPYDTMLHDSSEQPLKLLTIKHVKFG